MNPATAVIPALSQSRYELMACPPLYRERIVLGHQEPENVYALRGTQIHHALSKYIDYLVETKQASCPLTFDAIMREIAPLPDALEILSSLRDSFVIDPDKVLGTEMMLALDEEMRPLYGEDENDPKELYRADSVMTTTAIQGTLDLVLSTSTTEAEIWDWKSFYQIIEADTFQSKLYPFLLFQHYPGLETIRFKLQFVRYGTAAREVTYTKADLPMLERLVRNERQRQRRLHQGLEPFKAMPGAHCAYCPKLRKGCPISEINPYTTQTPGDRVAFALWLTAAKKENDRLLKDFCNAQGAIEISDANGNRYAAGFQLTEKKGYPATAVWPILAANDPELAKKVTISGLSTALKAKKRAPLAELLAPLVTVTAGTRFGIRGVEDEEEGEE